MTRIVALWTHGITGAASLMGAAVYGIRGLQNSDLSGYDDDCQACVAGVCERFEATSREHRVDRSIGGALLVYSSTSISGFAFLGSTDATHTDANVGVSYCELWPADLSLIAVRQRFVGAAPIGAGSRISLCIV